MPPETGPGSESEIEKALALHRAGDLARAKAIYARLYALNPRDTACAHGLGLIALDEGRGPEALPLIARSVAIDPDNALYRISFGLALLANGDAEQAAAHLLDAANRASHLADPRYHLARALVVLKRESQALDVLTDSVRVFPDRADLWVLKGAVERALGRGAAAEASLRTAHGLAPNDANILNNLGAVLRDAGRADEAVVCYRAALALAPSRAVTHTNLGNTLGALGRLDEAESHLRQAITLEPRASGARLGLALLFAANERPAEALPLLNKVLADHPGHTDALTNRGVALLATGDAVGAEASYRDVLARDPHNAEAHYNLAWVLLLTGRWREGWDHYEWRWRLKYFSSTRRDFRQPLWDGRAVAGTLLIHAEQGFGDAIQFARFLQPARARCGRLVFECRRPLVRLLADIPGVDQIVAAGDPLPPFDAQVALMTLPRLLEITPDNIPRTDAYIKTPAEIPPRLQLPPSGRRRIGLVWAGSADNKIDRRRSFSARLFAPLLEEDADFVSLQIGERAAELGDLRQAPHGDRIVFDCAGRVSDFTDTAAVVGQLDLIVGVDTAVIHLGGAIGIPVWLLLPFMPDYRWLLGRTDTPWYSSIRLFRQEKSGDWPEVIVRAAAALREARRF